MFRTARKRNASVWGISQTAEDFVGTEASPRVHGAGIVKNASTKIIGQQPGDMRTLRDHLHLNETALNQTDGCGSNHVCPNRNGDGARLGGEFKVAASQPRQECGPEKPRSKLRARNRIGGNTRWVIISSSGDNSRAK